MPRAYHQRLQLAFGIWLDYDWRHRGWSATEPSRNYMTPEKLESVVTAALHTSDEFVWIYNETPRWWGSTKPEARMPEAYVSALRRARATAR